MSYTLSDAPSPRADIIELADFWEVECLKKQDFSISVLDMGKMLGIIDDVQEEDDEIEDFKLEGKLQEVTDEIERRVKSCNGKYPFKLINLDYVLTLDTSVRREWLWIYTYLLLATRNNMLSNKSVEGVDGTKLFEKLSKDILLNYFGEYSDGMVFGTASANVFSENLKTLVQRLEEGILKSDSQNITYSPQDDKLDIVTWISFKDKLPSKLICFAQCKTGTHWQDTIHQLDISNFLKKWFSDHPRLDPIRAFMVADILNANDFYHKAGNNLFLDRCRLANFFVLNEGNDWFEDLKKWTDGVMKQFKLSFIAVN